MNTTFFSYSRSDSAFVLELAKDLRIAGINIWLDQLDIPAGSHWDSSIQKALESSDTLLIVLSPASVASENVMDEVSFALEEGKQVIPVLKENCEIPFRLRRVQRIDFTRDYNAGLNSLLSSLSSRNEQSEKHKSGSHADPKPTNGNVKKSLSWKTIAILAGILIAAFATWKIIDARNERIYVEQEDQLWYDALETGDSSSVIRYLDEYPNGFYSREAQARLDSIRYVSQEESVPEQEEHTPEPVQ